MESNSDVMFAGGRFDLDRFANCRFFATQYSYCLSSKQTTEIFLETVKLICGPLGMSAICENQICTERADMRLSMPSIPLWTQNAKIPIHVSSLSEFKATS